MRAVIKSAFNGIDLSVVEKSLNENNKYKNYLKRQSLVFLLIILEPILPPRVFCFFQNFFINPFEFFENFNLAIVIDVN